VAAPPSCRCGPPLFTKSVRSACHNFNASASTRIKVRCRCWPTCSCAKLPAHDVQQQEGSGCWGLQAGAAATPSSMQCCSAAMVPRNGHMPCLAGTQVVGDKHDVEEGAPVLKKTVFGEQLCIAAGTWRVYLGLAVELHVTTLAVPAIILVLVTVSVGRDTQVLDTDVTITDDNY
jgi:hypothetical protein